MGVCAVCAACSAHGACPCAPCTDSTPVSVRASIFGNFVCPGKSALKCLLHPYSNPYSPASAGRPPFSLRLCSLCRRFAVGDTLSRAPNRVARPAASGAGQSISPKLFVHCRATHTAGPHWFAYTDPYQPLMSLAVPHPDLSRRGPTGTAASVRGPVVSTNKHAERTRPTSRRQHHRSTSGAQDMLSTAAAAASAAPPPLASAAAGAQQSLLSVLATTWLSTERRRSAQRRELACKARRAASVASPPSRSSAPISSTSAASRGRTAYPRGRRAVALH